MNTTGENQTTAGAPPRLTRSTDDKIVSGVCGGLGRHFGVDPVVFRIAFVVMALAGGSGVLLYLVAWLLVPDDRSGGATVLDRARHGHSSQVLAIVAVAIGASVVLDNLGNHKGGGRFGGLVLLGVGAAVLWSRRGRSTTLPPPAGPGAVPPPDPWAPPPPRRLSPPGPGDTAPSSPPDADDTAPSSPPGDTAPSSDLERTLESSYEVPPSDAVTSELPKSGSVSATTAATDATTAVLAPEPLTPAAGRRPPSMLVAVTLSLLAILAGVLALLGGTGTVDVPLGVGLALALLVVGGALFVGAWWGRARWLVPLAVVLGVAVLATAAVDVPLRGGVGDRAYRPRTVAELQSPYRLAAGDLVVDLGRLDLSATTESVTATIGAGDLQVVVPDGAEVVVDAHVGAGSMTVFGRQFDGTDNGRHVVEPGREGGGRLILSARTGFGDLEVRHATS